MEWGIPKIAIVVLCLVVLTLLIMFYTGFSELLKKDKEIQGSIDDKRIEEIGKSLPSAVAIILYQIECK